MWEIRYHDDRSVDPNRMCEDEFALIPSASKAGAEQLAEQMRVWFPSRQYFVMSEEALQELSDSRDKRLDILREEE